MGKKSFFLDASVLRINDGTPVKVTFLEARTSGHFVGFYTLDAGAFHDIRTLFPNVGPDTLISNVSSVFLGNRLNGKTPVFFVVENGYTLNKDAAWFNDAAGGRNGFWKFLKPAEEEGLTPVLEQGEIVWRRSNGETAAPAQEAGPGTHRPVLIWQSNSGRIFVLKGNIFHSFGYGLYPELNPDQTHRFLLTPQEDGASVILSFADGVSRTAEQKPEISFCLHIGERNFAALTRNRIIGAILPLPEIDEPVLSAGIEIPDDFDDVLFLEGFEDQQTLPAAGTTFLIESKGNRLTIKGEAVPAVYEALLSCVKIRTDASAVAKSAVKVTFQTAKGEIVKSGETEILSEKAQLPFLPASVSLPKTAPAADRPGKIFSEILPPFAAEEKDDDLPAFLTQPLPAAGTPGAVKQPSGAKTALITGGAHRRGKEIAHALAARGYNVIVHCHTAVAEATHLVEELRQTYHVKTAYFRADFNSFDETADLLDSVSRTYGPVDLLVCQAGAFSPEETAAGWEINTSVNLRAPFILMNAFARCLPKGRTGCILSVFHQPPDEFSSYALSCLAMDSLIGCAARRFKERIRVNGLAVACGQYDESVERRVIDAVCFLAQTPVVSGQILRFDGACPGEKKK